MLMMCICFLLRLPAGRWVYRYQLTSTTKIFCVFWFDNGVCKLHYLANDAASCSFCTVTYACIFISLQTCFRNWHRWSTATENRSFRKIEKKKCVSQTNWLNWSELICIVQKLQNWVAFFTPVCSSDGRWILGGTVFACRSALKICGLNETLQDISFSNKKKKKKNAMFRNCQGHQCWKSDIGGFRETSKQPTGNIEALIYNDTDLALLLHGTVSIVLIFVYPSTFQWGLVHVLASCGRVVSRVKKPKLPECQRKCFGLIVVDVCACGPGQQHVFWLAGVGPAARCSVNNVSPVEWDRC